MKKYKVTPKELERIKKQAEKIDRIIERGKALKAELDKIKEKERWLCYLSADSCSGLTTDQQYELNRLTEIIMCAEIN